MLGGEVRAGRREGLWVVAAQAGCRQRTQLWRLLAGARAERTRNMDSMVVTLDVSQLSGWLNADAACRVERESIKRAATGGPGGGRAWGGGGASGVHGDKARVKAWGAGRARSAL